jgi:2-polyprenyl-6-methoxyphenol hydroxylase-like FAD-dependent oxidoreductase
MHHGIVHKKVSDFQYMTQQSKTAGLSHCRTLSLPKPLTMHVLISGGGIAGPTVAWFLSKRPNNSITIVEKAPSLLPHGQNIEVEGTAMRLIKQMGLWDDVRRCHTGEKGTVFIDPNGKPFAPLPVVEGHGGSASSQYEILRGDLAKIICEATMKLPNVDFRFDTTITNVIENGKNAVTVELSNGEQMQADILIAADGHWSKTRRTCFPADMVRGHDLGMIGVYWTLPRQGDDNDFWNVYVALRRRIVTLRPDPYGTIRALFTCMPRDDAHRREWHAMARSDRATQAEFLRNEFADAGWQTPRLLGSMEKAPDFYFHVMEQVKMTKWSRGRVVCVGDAAYAATPLTGMGTPLAMMGAYILAGELSQLSDEDDPAKAFVAYEDKFRTYVEEVQKVPSFIPGIMHPVNAWQRWVLQSGLRFLSFLAHIPGVVERFGDDPGKDTFALPVYDVFENWSEVPAGCTK